MTLVAGFSMGGPPAFVGDLLTSWRIPSEAYLPSRPDMSIHKMSDGFFAQGLAQKLVIIRPYLLIAWAGSVAEANKLITLLDEILPRTYTEWKRDPDSLLSILDELPTSIEVVAVLLSSKWIQPLCIHTRGFQVDGKRFYLLGSGSSEVFNFLEYITKFMPEPDSSEGVAATATLINFAANAIAAQYASGFGISEAWGGGFEVVQVTRKAFRKVDNILVRCWSLDPNWSLRSMGTSFLMHYEGASLKISSFGEFDRTTTVKSWLKEKAAPKPRSEVVADWTVDLFYLTATGHFVHAVQKEHPWSRNPPRFSFSDGILTGWTMDESRVEKIVSKIKLDGALTVPFSMTSL